MLLTHEGRIKFANRISSAADGAKSVIDILGRVSVELFDFERRVTIVWGSVQTALLIVLDIWTTGWLMSKNMKTHVVPTYLAGFSTCYLRIFCFEIDQQQLPHMSFEVSKPLGGAMLMLMHSHIAVQCWCILSRKSLEIGAGKLLIFLEHWAAFSFVVCLFLTILFVA